MNITKAHNFKSKEDTMLKKTRGASLKHFSLSFFILLISAAFILGTGTAPAQAAAKGADALKSAAPLCRH